MKKQVARARATGKNRVEKVLAELESAQSDSCSLQLEVTREKRCGVMKIPEVACEGSRLRAGKCALGHDDSIGQWDQGFCVDIENVDEHVDGGKKAELKCKKSPFSLGDRMGLVLTKTKLHGCGSLTGEAIMGKCFRSTSQWKKKLS